MGRQKRGQAMLARAVFGQTGTASVAIPRYESRRWELTDRIDTPTEHYVGERYSHTTTSTRYDTRYENRSTQVGIDHLHHKTIDVVFEYPENERMTMRSPYWARQGDLVYVMCHRGVGRHVYDLYCPARDQWEDLQTDERKPLSFKVPLVAGAAELFVQVQLLQGPKTWFYALATTAATYGLLVIRRGWFIWQLRASRIRGNKKMINLIRSDHDTRDEIRRSITARI